MMLCIHFENVGDDGEVRDEEIEINGNYDMLEWFTGSCDLCKKKIRSKHHAVRMPMTSGGWDGCYCSWSHVRQDVVDKKGIIPKLIDAYEKDVKKIGIYDRGWEEEVQETIVVDHQSFMEESKKIIQEMNYGKSYQMTFR